MPLTKTAVEITHRCIDSFKGMVSRVIAIQNGFELPEGTSLPTCDVYVKEPFNILMAGAVNRGYIEAIKFEDCEFLCFANNDTWNENMDFGQLCEEGIMRSPSVDGQKATYGAHASFFVIHKNDFAKIGYWNLEYGSAADEHWFRKAQQFIHLEQIPNISVHHMHGFSNGLMNDLCEKEKQLHT